MFDPNRHRNIAQNIAILKPCCLGDVVMATVLLDVLHRALPRARLTWYANSSGAAMLNDHPWLDSIVDTGKAANPAKSIGGLLKLAISLHQGQHDLIVVPDRSPLYALAALLAGIPTRAGLNSAGRGLLYTYRANIDPTFIEAEARIYLRVADALGLSAYTPDARLFIPPPETPDPATANLVTQLAGRPFFIVHPGGGVNAGMTMTSKRWPSDNFAEIAARLIRTTESTALILGAPSDKEAVESCIDGLIARGIEPIRIMAVNNLLPVSGVAYLGSRALIYLSNDSGLGHLVTAAGGKVAMIFGPTDPRRYAPFAPASQARAIWRPVSLSEVDLREVGLRLGSHSSFNWARDGASVDEVWSAVQDIVGHDKVR